MGPFNFDSYKNYDHTTALVCKWLEHHLKKYLLIQSKLQQKKSDYGTHVEFNEEEVKDIPFKIVHVNWATDKAEEWDSMESALGLLYDTGDLQEMAEQGKTTEQAVSSKTSTTCAHIKMEITYLFDRGLNEGAKSQWVELTATEKDEGTSDDKSDENELPNTNPYTQKKLNMDNRQLALFSRAMTHIQKWVDDQGLQYEFPIPICFYGKDEQCLKSTVKFNFGERTIMDRLKAGLNAMKAPKRKFTHSLLIVEDFNPRGFICDESPSLSIFKTTAALKALAKFHATTWAFAENSGNKLGLLWPFLMRPYSARFLITDIKIGLRRMRKLLRKRNDEKETIHVTRYLKSLQPRLDQIWEKIQKNNFKSKVPQCIVHQNLNSSNILVRQKLEKVENILEIKEANDNNLNDSTIKDWKDLKGKPKPILKREVKFINWKTASVGNPFYDVAFMLFTCLDPQIRHDNEDRLVKLYWEAFLEQTAALNVKPPNCTNLSIQQEYFKGLLRATLLVCANVDKDSEHLIVEDCQQIFFSAVLDVSKHVHIIQQQTDNNNENV